MKKNPQKELWLPHNDWKTTSQASAPWIRASWSSDAWNSGVRYVQADKAEKETAPLSHFDQSPSQTHENTTDTR